MIRLGIVTNGTLGLIYASHAKKEASQIAREQWRGSGFLFRCYSTASYKKTSMLLFDFLGHYKQYTD